LLRADDGTDNTGALYSYGTVSSTDRALGSIASNAVTDVTYALCLRNNTTRTLGSVTIHYKGEQWRAGGNATVQWLKFAYYFSDKGVWNPVSYLDFSTPC
jgi:hypothetical protein